MKKIKIVFWVACAVVVIIVGNIIAQVVAGIKEDERRDKVQALIDNELNSGADIDTTEPETMGSIDLGGIVAGGIEDATVTPMFSDIVMIDSSTFTAVCNGTKNTYHLIGVAGNGNQETVKAILEEIRSGTITFDTMKERNGVKQIYLWLGSTDNVSSMVNIQLVKLKICGTTYAGTGYSESPNIRYSSKFIDASK